MIEERCMLQRVKIIACEDEHLELCKQACQILNCNLLWVMNLNLNVLNLLVTDKAVLQHYYDKQYYLGDLQNGGNKNQEYATWNATFGTDDRYFNNNGFMYDLNKMFNIEEFVSIKKNIGKNLCCFRFFTRNNRFIFMSKLINELPIIKCFMDQMVDILQPSLNVEKTEFV